MLLIPADRTAGWIGLESEECIIRICFCFLASISSDWARWRDRERGGEWAQHAASLQRNPFIALMSVKMPDERYGIGNDIHPECWVWIRIL